MKKEEFLKVEEFKEMFINYKDMLYGYVFLRVRNRQEAEDLLSKTFIKFFKYAQKNLVYKDKLKSFLFTIAANTLNDFFRRRKIIKFISLDRIVGSEEKDVAYYEFFKDTKSQDPRDTLDKESMLLRINKEADRLSEKQKEAFYLRFIEGFSFADIATIQKTSLSTALSRVRYAVNKIKDNLKIGELI